MSPTAKEWLECAVDVAIDQCGLGTGAGQLAYGGEPAEPGADDHYPGHIATGATLPGVHDRGHGGSLLLYLGSS